MAVLGDGFGLIMNGLSVLKVELEKLQKLTAPLAVFIIRLLIGESSEYLGSSHLVKVIAENSNKNYGIFVSDRDKDARSNLKHSELRLIELPNDNDGRRIFDEQEKYNFNLILIDPYSEFILDMKENKVRDNFLNFKKEHLSGIAVSLRCPKIEEKQSKGIQIIGESKYDSEILLISKQFGSKPNIDSLKKRLKKFATEARQVLPLNDDQDIEVWPKEGVGIGE